MASALMDKVMKEFSVNKMREVRIPVLVDAKFADDLELIVKNSKRLLEVEANVLLASKVAEQGRKFIEQLAKDMRELDVKPASKASVKESVSEVSEDTDE